MNTSDYIQVHEDKKLEWIYIIEPLDAQKHFLLNGPCKLKDPIKPTRQEIKDAPSLIYTKGDYMDVKIFNLIGRKDSGPYYVDMGCLTENLTGEEFIERIKERVMTVLEVIKPERLALYMTQTSAHLVDYEEGRTIRRIIPLKPENSPICLGTVKRRKEEVHWYLIAMNPGPDTHVKFA